MEYDGNTQIAPITTIIKTMVTSSQRGNGLFSLLVVVTLACSIYDLSMTVRHLESQQSSTNCFEETVRKNYFNQDLQQRQALPQQSQIIPHSFFPTFPTDKPIPLLLLPEQLKWQKRMANARHLIQDGVAQSLWLTWWERNATKYPDNLVLVLDLLGARESNNWCSSIIETLTDIQQERLAQRKQRNADNNSPPDPLPMVIVDNRDYAVISYCPGLARMLLQGHNGTLEQRFRNAAEQQQPPLIRYSYRSAVHRRKWQPKFNWVRVGKLLMDENETKPELNDDDDETTDDDQWISYRHRPIGVRTDIVQQVQEYLTINAPSSNSEDEPAPSARQQPFTSLCHPLEEMPRSIHLSYFWDHQNHSRSDAHLRDTVYEVLDKVVREQHVAVNETMTQTTAAADKYWNFQLGVQGENRNVGRKRASRKYVVALMQSRIVVVAQRDEWEDHYRLFEAIVSGAMVMTDRMLGLPNGLVDGESVVTFASAQELREKVEYYLAHSEERLRIAKQGRYVAMSRHRSWHHMEETVFGRPVTACETGTRSIKCPCSSGSV
ncbi:hypothetical protein MPSEU_000112100 [Mayamaea pseudoterrestris]|nr:hypothetical protein MPSEU_000112100 [Mayamaea pseudoterrestris]